MGIAHLPVRRHEHGVGAKPARTQARTVQKHPARTHTYTVQKHPARTHTYTVQMRPARTHTYTVQKHPARTHTHAHKKNIPCTMYTHTVPTTYTPCSHVHIHTHTCNHPQNIPLEMHWQALCSTDLQQASLYHSSSIPVLTTPLHEHLKTRHPHVLRALAAQPPPPPSTFSQILCIITSALSQITSALSQVLCNITDSLAQFTGHNVVARPGKVLLQRCVACFSLSPLAP